MTHAPPPRWLVAGLAGLLVLPFAPDWPDFELARRGLLLALLGALLLARPNLFAGRPRGAEWLLLAFVGWQGLAAAAAWLADGLVWPDAMLRLCHVVALWLCWRVAGAWEIGVRQRVATVLLVIAAAFGLLQRLGLAEIAGYGVRTQPVSAFGNLNVAAEFTAVAGAAAAAAFAGGARGMRLAAAALVLAGAYAAVNGSRSALLALPAAALWVAATLRGAPLRRRVLPLLAVGIGLLAGTLLDRSLPVEDAPPRDGPVAAAAGPAPSASIEVRLEIARSGLAMVHDAPLLGHGPGQFAVQYPRWRSQREIELSSDGRSTVRRVGTAHDDWLEVAIEGGVPALLLLLAFAVGVVRSRQDRSALAPLLALGLLMAVRAPLGNAAAGALALLVAAPGRAVDAPSGAGADAERRRRAWRWRLLGVPLLLVGGLVVIAQTLFADAVRERRHVEVGDPAAVERALAVWPYDPSAWQLLATTRSARARSRDDVLAAIAAADRAVALRPHEPSFRLLRADLYRLAGDFARARDELRAAERLDPGDPQLAVQLAGLAFTQLLRERASAADELADVAVRALWANGHPRLRTDLAQRFDEFAELAAGAARQDAQRRFVAEAAFVRALDALAATGRTQRAAAAILVEDAAAAFAAAGRSATDLRVAVLEAVLAHARGDDATAARIAATAAARGARLPDWSRASLAPQLDALRAVPAWQPLLP